MSEVVLHPREAHRRQCNDRLDDLRDEFMEFCRDFRPGTQIDEKTASLAAVFTAFKLDGGEGW